MKRLSKQIVSEQINFNAFSTLEWNIIFDKIYNSNDSKYKIKRKT